MGFSAKLVRAAQLRSTRAFVAVVLLAILVAAVLGFVVSDRAIAANSVLSVIDGEVLVRPVPEARFRTGQDGETLKAGMSVQTNAPYGRAVLTFKDGSTAELEPDATVSIDEVAAGTRGEMVVRLEQTRGRTWVHVQPLLSPNSRFHIKTPSATAVVRGFASFEIEVEELGANGEVVTRVKVFKGEIDMVGTGVVQRVSASQTTEVVQGSAPGAPKEVGPAHVCLRVALSSSAMMTVTDPYDRSAGQTLRGTVSQIPRSTVTSPQEQPQLVDIFSPKAGDWEVGIVPRGDGGAFHLAVNTVVGTKTGTSKVLTGSIQPGQRLVTHIRLGDEGQVDRFDAFQQVTQTRAKIVDLGSTTTAPLPLAIAFIPAVDRPSLCAGP